MRIEEHRPNQDGDPLSPTKFDRVVSHLSELFRNESTRTKLIEKEDGVDAEVRSHIELLYGEKDQRSALGRLLFTVIARDPRSSIREAASSVVDLIPWSELPEQTFEDTFVSVAETIDATNSSPDALRAFMGVGKEHGEQFSQDREHKKELARVLSKAATSFEDTELLAEVTRDIYAIQVQNSSRKPATRVLQQRQAILAVWKPGMPPLEIHTELKAQGIVIPLPRIHDHIKNLFIAYGIDLHVVEEGKRVKGRLPTGIQAAIMSLEDVKSREDLLHKLRTEGVDISELQLKYVIRRLRASGVRIAFDSSTVHVWTAEARQEREYRREAIVTLVETVKAEGRKISLSAIAQELGLSYQAVASDVHEYVLQNFPHLRDTFQIKERRNR